jgi:DNA-directed RNA polymerase subunit N (RpoN/RPB10)
MVSPAVRCLRCGEMIMEMWQLFSHEPVCKVLVDEASRLEAKVRTQQAELQKMTARHYGLGPLPWRTNKKEW